MTNSPKGRNPIKTKYHAHKQNAKLKLGNVEFLLTFEEWWKLWEDSGRWAQRGIQKGQYCMARIGDRGPYAIGNVRIITVEENRAEMWANPETRDKLVNSVELREIRRQNAMGNKNCLGKQTVLGKRWKLSPEVLARRNAKRKAIRELKKND